MRSLRNPTTEGSVSLKPIGFLKTSTSPLTHLAIKELVVPRSMAMLIMLSILLLRVFAPNDDHTLLHDTRRARNAVPDDGLHDFDDFQVFSSGTRYMRFNVGARL